jgi:hypothetical protein
LCPAFGAQYSGILSVLLETPWGWTAAFAITTGLFFLAAIRTQFNLEATEGKLLSNLYVYFDANDPLCRHVEDKGDKRSKHISVTCRIKVKTLGSRTVDDVKIVLLHSDTGTFYGGIFRPMGATHRETGEFKLHPNTEVYVDIKTWYAAELNPNNIQEYGSTDLTETT